MNEPLTVTQGETVTWTESLSDYPASEWTLKYSLRSRNTAVATIINLTATADSTNHLIEVTSVTTAAWIVDKYWWYAWVEKGTGVTIEKHAIASGQLEVLQDLSTVTADYDGRSHAKTMLDAIEATLEGKATAEQLDLIQKTIGDKNITKNPKLLMDWRTYYRNEYQSELNKEAALAGRYAGGKIRTKFIMPT